MAKMTEYRWKLYRKDPGSCPFCHAKGSIRAGEHDFGGLEAWQTVSCEECGEEFVELFKMTGLQK